MNKDSNLKTNNWDDIIFFTLFFSSLNSVCLFLAGSFSRSTKSSWKSSKFRFVFKVSPCCTKGWLVKVWSRKAGGTVVHNDHLEDKIGHLQPSSKCIPQEIDYAQPRMGLIKLSCEVPSSPLTSLLWSGSLPVKTGGLVVQKPSRNKVTAPIGCTYRERSLEKRTIVHGSLSH